MRTEPLAMMATVFKRCTAPNEYGRDITYRYEWRAQRWKGVSRRHVRIIEKPRNGNSFVAGPLCHGDRSRESFSKLTGTP